MHNIVFTSAFQPYAVVWTIKVEFLQKKNIKLFLLFGLLEIYFGPNFVELQHKNYGIKLKIVFVFFLYSFSSIQFYKLKFRKLDHVIFFMLLFFFVCKGKSRTATTTTTTVYVTSNKFKTFTQFNECANSIWKKEEKGPNKVPILFFTVVFLFGWIFFRHKKTCLAQQHTNTKITATINNIHFLLNISNKVSIRQIVLSGCFVFFFLLIRVFASEKKEEQEGKKKKKKI